MALSLSRPAQLSFAGCEISQVCSSLFSSTMSVLLVMLLISDTVLCRKKQYAREGVVPGGSLGPLGDNGLDFTGPMSPHLIL